MSLGALVRPDIQRETRETHPAETGAHLLVVMTQQELLEREVRKETQLGLSHIVLHFYTPAQTRAHFLVVLTQQEMLGRKQTSVCRLFLNHPAETGAHLLVVMTQQELLERYSRETENKKTQNDNSNAQHRFACPMTNLRQGSASYCARANGQHVTSTLALTL